jgi:hypothetical protein
MLVHTSHVSRRCVPTVCWLLFLQVSQPPQELLGDAGAGVSANRFFHLGMGQASPDGQALMFLHR